MKSVRRRKCASHSVHALSNTSTRALAALFPRKSLGQSCCLQRNFTRKHPSISSFSLSFPASSFLSPAPHLHASHLCWYNYETISSFVNIPLFHTFSALDPLLQDDDMRQLARVVMKCDGSSPVRFATVFFLGRAIDFDFSLYLYYVSQNSSSFIDFWPSFGLDQRILV